MDTLGLTDLFVTYSQNRSTSAIDLFAEISHLKRTGDQYRWEYLKKEAESQDFEGKFEMERIKN